MCVFVYVCGSIKSTRDQMRNSWCLKFFFCITKAMCAIGSNHKTEGRIDTGNLCTSVKLDCTGCALCICDCEYCCIGLLN